MLKFKCAISFLATINKPEVSLSNLCTIPGLISPPIPDKLSLQIAIIALTKVPSQFPFAGCTTKPFGLLTTIISLSSYTTSTGISCAFKSTTFASGSFISITSFSFTLYETFELLLLTFIFSSSTNLLTVVLDNSFNSEAIYASNLIPDCSEFTTNFFIFSPHIFLFINNFNSFNYKIDS